MLLIKSKRTKREDTSYEYSPYVENDQSWTMACEEMPVFPLAPGLIFLIFTFLQISQKFEFCQMLSQCTWFV